MNKQNKLKECVFCNSIATREISEDLDFFSSNNKRIFICNECFKVFSAGSVMGQFVLNNKMINLIMSAADSDPVSILKDKISQFVPASKTKLSASNGTYQRILSPQDFYKALNRKVVGQESAKKRISIAVYEHLKNIQKNSNDKSNILFLGPSGSGKTLIVNTLSHSLDVPFVTGDATSFSPTGFQGADADSVVVDLFVKTNGNIELAQKGVVFIDEIDKLCNQNSHGSRLESFNYSTQSTLLKLIEGKIVKIPSSIAGDSGPQPTVNTSKMLFCFGGAFNNLEKIVANKIGVKGKTIGFRNNNSEDYEEQVKNYEIYSLAAHDILTESLIEFGMSTEFVGRIQTIVPLMPLTKEQMIKCLLELEDSPILKNKLLFAESNLELDFADDYFETVVDKAIKSGTGTRALNSIVKTSVSQAAFEYLGNNSNHKRIIISKDCVNDPCKYEIA